MNDKPNKIFSINYWGHVNKVEFSRNGNRAGSIGTARKYGGFTRATARRLNRILEEYRISSTGFSEHTGFHLSVDVGTRAKS